MKGLVTIKLKHTDGDVLTWKARRHPRPIDAWVLTDHDRYDRVLESTWAMSVPRIRMIASNHGCEITTAMGDEVEAENDNDHIFDGFCHRPYDEKIDGWRRTQTAGTDHPVVEVARQIIDMAEEIDRLRHRLWEWEQGHRTTDHPNG